MNEKNAIIRAFNTEDAIPVNSQMIALVISKLVADPRFDPITSTHRLQPCVGAAGYNTTICMKRAAITIHMNEYSCTYGYITNFSLIQEKWDRIDLEDEGMHKESHVCKAVCVRLTTHKHIFGQHTVN